MLYPYVFLFLQAIMKVASDKEAFDKQIEDLEDQKKIVVANANHLRRRPRS